MNLNEIIQKVHQNAVAHGWWETDRPISEVFALIHAELSEALEEARAGRAPAWYRCTIDEEECCGNKCAHFYHGCTEEKCKPEGIAVELIDAAIRLMDFLGHKGIHIDGTIADIVSACDWDWDFDTIAVEINCMHGQTSQAYEEAILYASGINNTFVTTALGLLSHIFQTVESLDCDPKVLLLEKHEYNTHREYKHGKLF